MRKIWIALVLFSISCTDPVEPKPEALIFYFEVEVEGQKFRQELLPDLPDENHPLVFDGGFLTEINEGCTPDECISPFFINMLFAGNSGSQQWEQVEMIQVPSGSYTSHFWYGESDETPTPSEGRVTITKKDLSQKLIQGTFEGEVYKTGTQTPIKIPIKGSFSAKYLQ
ncbi:hypothetical protein [Algoriphagus hitonicola]|uniref:Lipoprotein n=1 Tax=Algoriphagus hitonicola TaxID=435880 RepID=A0A1I2V4S2_9BACT|nr:hypothetical protein [Algoriphagus hitonicola]SFG84414.1 hypothetical protein SAMN04487988_10911 [Algoriphagus hitonicola]